MNPPLSSVNIPAAILNRSTSNPSRFSVAVFNSSASFFCAVNTACCFLRCPNCSLVRPRRSRKSACSLLSFNIANPLLNKVLPAAPRVATPGSDWKDCTNGSVTFLNSPAAVMAISLPALMLNSFSSPVTLVRFLDASAKSCATLLSSAIYLLLFIYIRICTKVGGD